MDSFLIGIGNVMENIFRYFFYLTHRYTPWISIGYFIMLIYFTRAFIFGCRFIKSIIKNSTGPKSKLQITAIAKDNLQEIAISIFNFSLAGSLTFLIQSWL